MDREYMFKLARLGEIFEMSTEAQLNLNLDELQSIVDSLKPEDYAVYGRDLCNLLINIAHGRRLKFTPPKRATAENPTECVSRPLPAVVKKDVPLTDTYPAWLPTHKV